MTKEQTIKEKNFINKKYGITDQTLDFKTVAGKRCRSTLQICLQSEYRSHRRLAAAHEYWEQPRNHQGRVICSGDIRCETIGSVGIMTARSEIRSAKMAGSECEIGYWISEPYWGQGLIPEAVSELIRYAFEDLQMTTVWCGYFDGNEKSKRVQEKCGFTYSHTEYNKPVPLMNDVRTEHFTKLTLEEWRKRKDRYENWQH